MLRGGLSMAITSIWTSMANWSTPTILFCALNLMIIIIFVVSNSKSPLHHHHPSQIARSPSLPERVKSVNLSSLYGTTESHGYYETTADGYNSASHLNRRPSLLQRVKSIGFSFSSFNTTPPDQPHDSISSYSHHHESEQTHYDSPSQLVGVPSLSERFKSIKFSTESEQLSNLTGEPEPSGVPSLLDRIKSFKLTPSFKSNHHSDETFSSHDQQSDMDPDPHHDSIRDNEETKIFDKGPSVVTGSKSEKSSETPAKKSPMNLTKSNGKNRVAESNNSDVHVDKKGPAPAAMKATIGAHNESVDAKADDFIKRFKQQLKLQRIASLERFREMLNRSG